MRRAKWPCLLLALLAFHGGCAGNPVFPRHELPRPPSDRAYIYVYRTSPYRGPTKIWLDGVLVGSLTGDKFAFVQVRPGRHVLVSESYEPEEFPVHVIGGEEVYLEQEVTVTPVFEEFFVSLVGGVAIVTDAERMRRGALGSELQQVSRAEGRAAVRERGIIPDRPPPLPPASNGDASNEVRLTGGPQRVRASE
jgi:hypothetical protein